MRTAGNATLATLGGSYRLSVWADVWYANQLVASEIPITGGSISFDISQDISSRLEIVVGDSGRDLTPVFPTDPLGCYGQEININVGVAGGSALAEPLSLGWFRIQHTEVNQKWYRNSSGAWRSGGSVINVTALDRMATLADARLLAVQQPPLGSTVFSEIRRLLGNLVPMGVIDSELADAQVPSNIVYEQDRVVNIVSLARALGAIVKMDSNGYLNVKRATAYGDTPIWTFTAGEGGTIIDYSVQMSRDGVYNSVMVTGEANQDLAPCIAIAYDLDPNSPSRWGGPFGEVPMFYSSPLITTYPAAQMAAATRLNNMIRGRDREFTFSVVPNHVVELDDPVEVILPDRTIPGRISKLTLPLTPGSMSVTIRALDSSIVVIGD